MSMAKWYLNRRFNIQGSQVVTRERLAILQAIPLLTAVVLFGVTPMSVRVS